MELQIYDNWIEAKFRARPNRFAMELERAGEPIRAYVPNTGRMSEFLFWGQPFFLTESVTPKFNYRVIGTEYQNSYVFLDTIKTNDLFHSILEKRLVEDFRDVREIRREVAFESSRFDFMVTSKSGKTSVIEIKSCTLCHNGLAMFPDAPTTRGQKHILDLEKMAQLDHSVYIIYLVLNYGAKNFMPNFHTDFEYGKLFLASKNVNFCAYKIDFVDPITANLDSLQEIPIDYEKTRKNCENRGSYVLILENRKNCEVEVGKLGKIQFPKGYYVYVGSAMNSLDSRVKRHGYRRKKKHWHMDYISPYFMKIKKVFPIRREDRVESRMAEAILGICDDHVKGFGATDSKVPSHLFYFQDSPQFCKDFMKIILDFMVIGLY